jgi:hypothetical protein
MTDVVAGNIQMLFADPVTGAELAKAGKIRALGVTSKTRVSVFPDIAPIADTVAGYEATNWHMVIAPAQTPAAVVEKLSAEFKGDRRLAGGQAADREDRPRTAGQSAARGTANVSRRRDCDLEQIRPADRACRIAVTEAGYPWSI